MITKKRDIRLLLDNIRSIHNVGSIFRTAETLGISWIYCAGTTPTPLDRFGRKRKDLAKVALGAEDSIQWEHMGDHSISIARQDRGESDSVELICRLKKEGFAVIALEQSKDSIDYKDVQLKDPLQERVLIILGAEVDGVSPELLRLADIIAEIPLRGKKESLNVSVAAGIFLYRLLDQT
jgi:tRNA G18 (ribose-2'-O)-methylase SpoU